MIPFSSLLLLLLMIASFIWFNFNYDHNSNHITLTSSRVTLASEHLSLRKPPNLKDDEDLDPDKKNHKPKPQPNHNKTTHDHPKEDPKDKPHNDKNVTKPDEHPKPENHTHPNPPKPVDNKKIINVNCPGVCNAFTNNDIYLRYRRKHLTQIHGTNSFLEAGAIVPHKEAKSSILCRLIRYNTPLHCQESYIAEVVDLAYSFQPVYSTRQNEQPMMYYHNENFKALMKSIGINVVVIEGIYTQLGQTFRSTRPGNEPWEIQITLYDKIFMRENLLNVAARKAKGWEYLLWIDSHQIFTNRYWWEDAIHKMEHYSSVQFFQTLAHQQQWVNQTDPRLDFPGSLYIWTHTRPLQAYRDRLHLWIGNAFGIRKELYEEIEFILDFCVSGCCDCAYNYASMHGYNEWDIFNTWPGYGEVFKPWIDKTRTKFKAKTTVVRGHMLHLWHERFFHFEEMLRAVAYGGFNPNTDLARDENFTLYLTNQRWKDLFATNG